MRNNSRWMVLGCPGTGRRAGAVAVVIAVMTTALMLLEEPADAAYEQPAIPDTAYAVPSGAVFVSNSGNDGASGTQGAPLRTVAKAVTKVGSGGTIILRQGTYREALGSISKRITLQPYPHEEVWMKGSNVVTGWVKSGTTWVKTGWTTSFCQSCYDGRAIDPAHPNAGRPDMVFVNGAPLIQVSSASAVTAGKFYVDYAADKLYIGTDPTSKTVEAAARSVALQLDGYAAGSIVRGIGFAHYASYWDPGNQPAAVVANAASLTFENDVFAWSASRGLVLYDIKPVVRGSTFLYSGFTGIGGHQAHGALLERNRVAGSNQERFSLAGNAVSGAAGVKITRTDNLVVRDNRFEDNYGTGMWCDESCYNTTIVNNLSRRNANHGLSFELTTKAIIASNVSALNSNKGLKISGSTDIRAYNNTLANNQGSQLGVYEDSRKNTNAFELSRGITWDTRNVVLRNNLMSMSATTTAPLIHTYDTNYPKQVGASDMIAVLNYGGYWRKGSSSPSSFSYWVWKTSANNYGTLPALRTGTSLEANGMAYDNVMTSPFYVDEATWNYNLKSGSPALGSGDVLSSDVASAIGVAAGVKVNRGALKGAGLAATSSSTVAPSTSPTMTMPVYSLFNSDLGDNLLTPSAAERDSAISRYGYTSRTGFKAASGAGAGVSPVYRLRGVTADDHLYTISAAERDAAISYGYLYEHVSFYASGTQKSGLVPLYRLRKWDDHLYTISAAERDSKVASGWVYEGVAFYVAP